MDLTLTILVFKS